MVPALYATIVLIISVGVDIQNTDIIEIQDSDWIGENRPDKNLVGLQGAEIQGKYTEDFKGNTEAAWFTMNVTYVDGTYDLFSVNLKPIGDVFDDSEFSQVIHSDHVVQFNPMPSSRYLYISVHP